MSAQGLAKAQLYDWDHVVDEVLDVYRVARQRASCERGGVWCSRPDFRAGLGRARGTSCPRSAPSASHRTS